MRVVGSEFEAISMGVDTHTEIDLALDMRSVVKKEVWGECQIVTQAELHLTHLVYLTFTSDLMHRAIDTSV